MGTEPKQRKDAAPSIWEWIVGGAGLALLLGAAGFLVYHDLTSPDSPPDIVVTAGQALPTTSGFVVQVRATNRGGETAAGVRIVGALSAGGETVEESELTIPFVPPGSEREGGLFFTRDPATLTLAVRATGYEKP
jgi:uncharacterized protein (TIGR02588 family)